jgi:ligand-binding SRPBCC domain-containing protein
VQHVTETTRLSAPAEAVWARVTTIDGVNDDYDDLTIVELEPGRRFLERSPMLSMRLWQHERIVEPDGDGCTVTDRLTFEPRVPVPAAPLIQVLFRHRHRRLRRRFGSPAGP